MTEAQTPSPPDADEKRHDQPDATGSAPASPESAPDQGLTWPPNSGAAMPSGSGSLAQFPAKGTLWPSALGWVMIVWAGNRLLTQAAGGVHVAYMAITGGESWEDFSRTNWSRNWPSIVLSGGTLLAIALAFLGGFLLLFRRRAGRMLLILWGILWIGIILGETGHLFFFMHGPLHYWQDWEPDWLDKLPGFLLGIGSVHMPGLFLPMGVLVWLLRGRIRRQVKPWRDPYVRLAERHALLGSRWPGVLGAILMIHGGLAILGTALRTTGAVILGEPWESDSPLNLMVTFAILPLALAVLGLVAGRLVYRRRPSGACLAIVFAVATVLLTLAIPVVQIFLFGEAYVQINRLELLLWKMSYALADVPWPAFLLIWFLRPPIRAQVRAWRAAR